TKKNGAYRFTAVAPGIYSLEARSGRLGRGELDDIEVAAGHEARMQAAMSLRPLEDSAPELAANPPLPDAHREAAGRESDSVAMVAPVEVQPRRGSGSRIPIGTGDVDVGGGNEIQTE